MAVLTIRIVTDARLALAGLGQLQRALLDFRRGTVTTAASLRQMAQQFQNATRLIQNNNKQLNNSSNAARNSARNFRNLRREMSALSNVLRADIFRSFTGQGTLFGAGLRLFAPLGGFVRGVSSLSLAMRGMFRIFQGGALRSVPNLFNAIGTAIGGIGTVVGSLIAQLSLFVQLLTGGIRAAFGTIGALLRSVPSLFTQIIGAAATMAGSLVGILGSVFQFIGTGIGELVRIVGETVGGIVKLIGEATGPIISAFEFLVAPITNVFSLIVFAWRNSLVIMGIGLGIFIAKSISQFRQFNRTVLEAVAQLPVGNRAEFQGAVSNVSSLAQNLGRQLGVDPTAIAGSVRQAVSVGFTSGAQGVRNLEDLVRAAGQLSVVGFSDLAETTALLTNVMNSFGDAAGTAAEASNLLFGAWRAGGGEFDFFAKGLGTVASVLAAYRANLEDAAAFTALLSQSAQGNSRIFIESARLVEQLVKQGRAVFKGGRLDLFGSLNQIREEVEQRSGGDPKKFAEAFQEIFPEARAERGLARFLARMPEDIKRIREEIRSADLQQAFAFLDETTARKITRMQTAFSNLQITLGGALLPSIGNLSEFLREFFEEVEGLILRGDFSNLKNAFNELLSAFGVDFSPQSAAQFIIDLAQNFLPVILQIGAAVTTKIKDLISVLAEFFEIEVSRDDILKFFMALRDSIVNIDIGFIFAKGVLAVEKFISNTLPAIKNWARNVLAILDPLSRIFLRIAGASFALTTVTGLVAGAFDKKELDAIFGGDVTKVFDQLRAGTAQALAQGLIAINRVPDSVDIGGQSFFDRIALDRLNAGIGPPVPLGFGGTSSGELAGPLGTVITNQALISELQEKAEEVERRKRENEPPPL